MTRVDKRTAGLKDKANSGSLRSQTRLAAAVVLVAVVLWGSLSWLGGELGLPVRYAFLIDFAALAAFFWSFVTIVSVWRRSRTSGD